MKKMVVLTGSFNPISRAHYEILSHVVDEIGADKGYFVAVNNDYLLKKMVVNSKTPSSFILPESTRVAMIESLNKDNPKLFFGGFELGNENPSTVRTLKKIMKENNGYELYFLVGADKIKGLGNWKELDKILDEIHVVTIKRNNVDVNDIISNHPLLKKYKDKIIVLDSFNDIGDVSSTKIRERFFSDEEYESLMNNGPYEILSKFTKDDFKPFTTEEIIKYTLKYGGRFSGNAARKLVYADNLKKFNEENGPYNFKNDIRDNNKVYRKEFDVKNTTNTYTTLISCVNEDCVDIAKKLIDNGFNPAILNMTSDDHPCGLYREGAAAQEESLCQMSNLSQYLYRYGNMKYKCVREAKPNDNDPTVYPLDINFGGIYSKDVYFFRHNIANGYGLRKDPFNCSVISVPSLAYNAKTKSYLLKYFEENGLLNSEGVEIEKNKIRTILRIGLENGHNSLVLGAFGCGVYQLNPFQVSNLFKDVFEEAEFKNKFKNIVFAIYEGKGSRRKVVGKDGKFKSFYDLFSKR